VLEGVEEEIGVCGCLEEAAAIVGLGGEEEGAVAGEASGLTHSWPRVPQRLKPLVWHWGVMASFDCAQDRLRSRAPSKLGRGN
jgi:hypothetical protein